MATLRQIVVNIERLARNASDISSEEQFSQRQIAFWVNTYRAKGVYMDLYRKLKEFGINYQLIQDLGCVPLEDVDKSECEVAPTGCIVKKACIPKYIDLPNNAALDFVGQVDKQTRFTYTQSQSMQDVNKSRFKNRTSRYFVIGSFVYVVTPNKGLRFINVRGIFENPELVCACNCSDGEKECFDWDKEYPFPERMIEDYITLPILANEFNIAMNTQRDLANDSMSFVQPTSTAHIPQQQQQQ